MKEKMLEAVNELPADAMIEDVMERFLFLAKVERGIQQDDAGQTVLHGEAGNRMAKRLNRGKTN